jgi:hypothetical protein
MVNQIRQILAPPVFEGDEAKTQVARVLNRLVLIAFVFALLYTFAFQLLTPLSTLNLALVLPFFPILTIALVLIHRGQIRAASYFLIGSTWLVRSCVDCVLGVLQWAHDISGHEITR